MLLRKSRNHEKDDTAARIMHLLKTKNAEPLKMAKDEVLREEFRNINFQRVTTQKIMKYFSRRWIDQKELYAVGPAIMALACEAVGGDPDATIPVAAAIVLIGSGAEVHDDIVDGSTIKNSRPTLVGKFGSSTALIAGDMLLTKGFALLNEKSFDLPNPGRSASIIEMVRNSIFEHADAEFLALELRGRSDFAPEKHLRVLRMRSSVVEAQARLGALIGCGAPNEIEALGRYGRLLGTLSLIRGEFIDMLEPEELDHRIRNECLPLPILLALQSTKGKGEIARMLKRTRRLTKRDKSKLVQHALENKKLEKLKVEMQKMAQAADLSIATLRSGPVASLRMLTKATLIGI